MMHKQKIAIIVAGGSGKRMGTEVPKQFLEVAGLPILMYAIQAFKNEDEQVRVVVVLPEHQHDYWNDLVQKFSFSVEHTLANGGSERFNSVQNALALVEGDGLVAIHDGVRPLVSLETIRRCFNEAEKHGAVIPVMPATESIRKKEDEINCAVNRANYFMVQTPQVFDIALLKKAYSQAKSNSFTDDASVVEGLGEKITMVEGNPENIKVTRPMDLLIADALLKQES